MKLVERSYKLLEATERALAGLAHEAGEARDYDQAARLIELARDVQQLAVQYGPQQTLLSSASSNAQGSVPVADRIAAQQPDVNRKRGRLGQYPKFIRDGDALVKIGWSKSAKNEYEHKSPKRVLTALVTAIMKAGFVVDGSWPIATEMQNRTRALSSAALSSSVLPPARFQKKCHRSTFRGWNVASIARARRTRREPEASETWENYITN